MSSWRIANSIQPRRIKIRTVTSRCDARRNQKLFWRRSAVGRSSATRTRPRAPPSAGEPRLRAKPVCGRNPLAGIALQRKGEGGQRRETWIDEPANKFADCVCHYSTVLRFNFGFNCRIGFYTACIHCIKLKFSSAHISARLLQSRRKSLGANEKCRGTVAQPVSLRCWPEDFSATTAQPDRLRYRGHAAGGIEGES